MRTKMNSSALRWLFRVSGKEKWNIVFLTLVQAFLGISSILFAWFLRSCIDCAVSGDLKGFISYAAAMIAVVALQITARTVKRFLDEYTKSGMENCFKTRLLQQLLTREYAQVTAVHSGEWMNRLTSDVVVVADGMTTILPDMIGTLVRLIGAVTALLILVPKLGYLVVPGGLLLLLISTVFRRVLKKLHIAIQEADGKLRILISERLASLLIVRTFAKEKQSLAEAGVQMQAHRRARMNRNRFSNICNLGFSLAMNGVYMASVLYCGYGIFVGTLSYGSFTAVLQLIGQVQSPFANLTSYLPKYYAMLASAQRLMEPETFDSADLDAALDLEHITHFYQNRFSAIGLQDACFTYQAVGSAQSSMPVVLQNVDLKISKGECVAFIGPSGSGKSTLLKLLMCLYPLDAGEIYLETRDGAMQTLDFHYTRLFAYVPQGNHLMHGSIREVVAFSDKDKMAHPEIIRNALEIACAWEFVEALPNGMDTVLGERGAGLSEGQMQRIAIARAICAGSPILVLDEATSALDAAVEQKLVGNLRKMTDKTVLLVTHRPAMLKLCSRQVVLKNNCVEVINRES